MAIDEVLEGRFVTGPGDAVEVDLAGPLLARRFDRRGFTVAGDSVGAQNQNATGRPATAAPSNSPLPTSGAVNRSASGTAESSVVSVGAATPVSGSFDPHAINVVAMTPRRNHRTTAARRLVGSACHHWGVAGRSCQRASAEVCTV